MNISCDAYHNFLLEILYSILGIWMLLNFSKLIKIWKPLNYIGKYSILFYFLNGGALTIISAVIRKVSFLNPENYMNQILVAILAIILMFPCVWFINKYMPIVAGNKESFNKVSQKLGLNIKW